MLNNDQLKARKHYVEQLWTTKQICDEHVDHLVKDSGRKVKIRLIDLNPILSKTYDAIEEVAPIEIAIQYAGSGPDAIFEFVETSLNEIERQDDIIGESEVEKAITYDRLCKSMQELCADLDQIAGFVTEEYNPQLQNSFYFLGVNNQGKGVLAVVDEKPLTPPLVSDHDPDIPF